MEGVSDAVVRGLLSELGGMDFCVSEFLRVTQHPLSAATLRKHVPELETGGRTRSGVPVQVQLLGSHPEMMAQSAARAVDLGALAIDLNFGCPARRVNGHDGGAALLKCPDRLEGVVAAVRRAVPSGIPVSTKIRLGFEDPDDVFDVVVAAEAAGSDWITIHGRTKKQMYRPPADWARIGLAADRVRIPVVANGDIFAPEDLDRCRAATGCAAFMVGRGAFRDPGLLPRLHLPKESAAHGPEWRWAWAARRSLLLRFVCETRLDPRFRTPDRAALARLKQWLRAMAEVNGPSRAAFEVIKRIQCLDRAVEALVNFSCAHEPTGPTWDVPARDVRI